jgi:hypothetical protein
LTACPRGRILCHSKYTEREIKTGPGSATSQGKQKKCRICNIQMKGLDFNVQVSASITPVNTGKNIPKVKIVDSKSPRGTR